MQIAHSIQINARRGRSAIFQAEKVPLQNRCAILPENHGQRLAGAFGIDLLGFAIMSNHFHLILRSRPDVVSTWDDTEVARRWLLICPVRKNSAGDPGGTGTGSVCGACPLLRTCRVKSKTPPESNTTKLTHGRVLSPRPSTPWRGLG